MPHHHPQRQRQRRHHTAHTVALAVSPSAAPDTTLYVCPDIVCAAAAATLHGSLVSTGTALDVVLEGAALCCVVRSVSVAAPSDHVGSGASAAALDAVALALVTVETDFSVASAAKSELRFGPRPPSPPPPAAPRDVGPPPPPESQLSPEATARVDRLAARIAASLTLPPEMIGCGARGILVHAPNGAVTTAAKLNMARRIAAAAAGPGADPMLVPAKDLTPQSFRTSPPPSLHHSPPSSPRTATTATSALSSPSRSRGAPPPGLFPPSPVLSASAGPPRPVVLNLDAAQADPATAAVVLDAVRRGECVVVGVAESPLQLSVALRAAFSEVVDASAMVASS